MNSRSSGKTYVAALVAAITLGLAGTAGPANATPVVQSDVPVTPGEPVQSPVPLAITVVFDKPGYRTGELVTAVLTIKNVGSASATVNGSQIFEDPGSLLPLNSDQWGELQGNGIPIAAGASHVVTLSGYPKSAEATRARVHAVLFVMEIGTGKQFASEVPVTLTRGDASGVVFGDADGDGEFDPGEGLPGVKLAWEYARNHDEPYLATSDGAGAFTFPNMPTTRYTSVAAEVNGWHLLSTVVEVGRTGSGQLRIRGVRKLTSSLKADLKFTKDSYRPGELAHVTVSLTNTGPYPVTGIVANCNRSGAPDGLPAGPGWGDLDSPAKGVTVPAGQTKTFDVTSTVPQGAFRTGAVFVGCDFAYQGYADVDNAPTAADSALVPGGRGGLKVTVKHNPDGDFEMEHPGVAGVKVIVVDDRACKVGELKTDQQGVAEFTGLVAGRNKYAVYYYPPAGWMMKTENPRTRLDLWAEDVVQQEAQASTGEGQVPGLPAPAPECDQPPLIPPRDSIAEHIAPRGDQLVGAGSQGRVVELANTGAGDVLGLGITGVVFLLLGTGAVVATRRRREG